MRKYYSERKGLLNTELELRLDELIQYFIQTYRYFFNKGYFNAAIEGVEIKIPYSSNTRQIMPPTLAPSPEVFFATTLKNKQVWPIFDFAGQYDEATLFSVIEILYDHIGTYDFDIEDYEQNEAKEEFVEKINSILKGYKNGYYLEPTKGFIMEIPNEALKEQLSYDGDEMPADVFEKLSTASQMYYRFDANMECKKKAINILADILENEREQLKDILNQEYEIPKNEHDKLIFGIVNTFNIRHNRADQKNDYSRDIWYDWMMQYYTSVIITYYKLKIKHSA